MRYTVWPRSYFRDRINQRLKRSGIDVATFIKLLDGLISERSIRNYLNGRADISGKSLEIMLFALDFSLKDEHPYKAGSSEYQFQLKVNEMKAYRVEVEKHRKELENKPSN